MKLLLDTNVVSELRKVRSGKADGRVAEWARQADITTLYLPAITLMELELGVLLAERRDARQGALLRGWLNEQVLPSFDGRIVAADGAVALRAAAMHVPDPRPMRDALIAATALVHDMTVVTRDVGDFVPCGVSVLNPWT